MTDPLVIAGTTFSSRLIAGTARYPNQQVMLDALAASGAELVTASIRRISLEGYSGSLIDLLGDRYRILPNTAGCVAARGARYQLGQARAYRRPRAALSRCRAVGACRRRAGAQGLCRTALLQRGPGQLPEARRCRLRPGDARGFADRRRHGDRQPDGDRADLLAEPGAGGARRGHRHRFRRGAGDGARL